MVAEPNIEWRKGVRHHMLPLGPILQCLEQFQGFVALASHRISVAEIAEGIIGAAFGKKEVFFH